MNLRAVRDHDETPPAPAVPDYEGKEVAATSVTLTSLANLDVENTVVAIDDVVRFVGEGRVVGVNHVVNDKTGQLVRTQRIKVIEIAVACWDEDDPVDDGVIRGNP